MNKKTVSAADLIPSTIEQALDLIGMGYMPVAGGTDLMVRNHAIKTRGGSVPPLFYTGRISGTGTVAISDGFMSIGSTATIAEIIGFQGTPGILKDALLSIASPGIRNTATLAGNICNASPAADSLPPLYVLDAIINTAFKTPGAEGFTVRKIPVSEFITGPGRTAASGSGLVTSVVFKLPVNEDYVFRKVGTRAANALSKLSVAAIWNKDNTENDFRLAAGACAATVIRSTEAEKIISRYRSEGGDISKALEIYESLLKPIDDQRSSARYRKNTALRLIKSIILGNGG